MNTEHHCEFLCETLPSAINIPADVNITLLLLDFWKQSSLGIRVALCSRRCKLKVS